MVANTKRHDHISPTLHSLQWLKIPERITYMIVSVTYYIIATAKPSYIAILITIQSARSTRSSKLVTLYRPAVTSRSTIRNRSFRYSAPIVWNTVPAELCCSTDSGSRGTNLLSESTCPSKPPTNVSQFLSWLLQISINQNP